MSVYSLSPGCYSLPLGCDLLWHLASHLSTSPPKSSMIILPTERAVHRLQRILFKVRPELLEHSTLKSYNQLAQPLIPNASTMPQVLWSLVDDPEVLNEFFLSNTPSSEQKQELCSALNSTLAELYANDIDTHILQRIAENDASTLQLCGLLKRYHSHLKQQNVTHPAKALNHGIRLFHQQLSTLDQTVYLIVDGLIPHALQDLAVDLSYHHYVWTYGQLPSSECPTYDPRHCYTSLANKLMAAGQSVHFLPIHTPRRRLIDELQQPLFTAKNISSLFKDLQFIESKDPISLAHNIVNIAQRSFSDTVRSVTVVTPSRELAKTIHLAATASNISVDDSCGISLNETMLGSLLLNILKYMTEPSNYKLLLNTIMHPLLSEHWGEFPSKLDKFGRKKEISFIAALRTYTAENDTDNERLLELIHLTQSSHLHSFEERLKHAWILLSKWKVTAENFPEYKVIFELSESLEGFEVLEYALKITPYRTLTPKEHHLQIMGPLETRLTQPKVVIIADLNEGSWPMQPPSNPWLHAKLRALLGLPHPRQITGLSSKILLSLLGCKQVYLCRTTHKSNQNSQPSRWWERLSILRQLNAVTVDTSALANNTVSAETTEKLIPFKLPNNLLPRRLSISNIHLLMNNPTNFILNCILKLEDLPSWDTPADVRHKGIIVHETLETALKQNLSIDAMVKYAMVRLNTIEVDPHEKMFWKSHITEHLHHFHRLHKETNPKQTWTEVSGEWTVNTQFGPLTIVGKADRIDLLPDGSLQIIDYKTGILPSKQSIYQGLTPQLSLLGIMATHGCFKDIPELKPFMVSYWGLKEGLSMNFLFDELSHLEGQFIKRLEQLLDTKTEYSLT